MQRSGIKGSTKDKNVGNLRNCIGHSSIRPGSGIRGGGHDQDCQQRRSRSQQWKYRDRSKHAISSLKPKFRPQIFNRDFEACLITYFDNGLNNFQQGQIDQFKVQIDDEQTEQLDLVFRMTNCWIAKIFPFQMERLN